ncbi:DUF1819 family protein [Humibacter ginsenosidimutans]|uniref:DUF1819 family protein n=1 Tax=Humibacter ginsenosidimutans TaxID=2599293 RepID=A0A5B8M7V9_9MICO|nr:DUF1819 family protein [Humibacter ginsenosidimutans]QDZ16289.1 DUF1819 family protein [Humibacter ginsenosidimutans]
MTSDNVRYRLSFTTGGLFVRESLLAAPVLVHAGDAAEARRQIMRENLLQQRTEQSKRTVSREVLGRLTELSGAELMFLADATSAERADLLWVAACRRFSFLADFADEVLRDRFLRMLPTVGSDDFLSFVRAKTQWHTELADLTPATLAKLRQNTFRMMREADLVSVDGHIVIHLPSSRFVDVMRERAVTDLRRFPLSDSEVELLTA